MNYGDYVIYVDESGDHGLTSIDEHYPVFVLDFCIFRKDDYANSIVPKMQEFKFKHFGHDSVVLHEQDIRNCEWPFVFLKDEQKKHNFMEDLNTLIKDADFTVIATIIDKKEFIERYIEQADPYELGLEFCMERAYRFLKDRQQHAQTTHIVAESRGSKEDGNLRRAFERIRDGGSYIGESMPFELIVADKKINSTGLQLADLTARPIGRHVINPGQENRAWKIIEKKLRKSHAGKIKGYGLKIFP